ncbi:hypothetical protein OT109_13130 [Phycisphaeraceae bacterium D3-23]
MFCLGCGYNLKQLTEPRCPECGRGFDARDRRTWGSARAFRFRRGARVAGWLLFVAATPPTLLGFAKIALGEDPAVTILIWMIALLPVVALMMVWVGCLSAGGAWPRLRAGVCILAVVVLNASYFTHWPAEVGFALSRDALNHAAQQAKAGQLSGPFPRRIGVYRVHSIGVTYTGSQPGAVVFDLSPQSDGPDTLVFGLSDAEVKQRVWLWSSYPLDQDWHLLHED